MCVDRLFHREGVSYCQTTRTTNDQICHNVSVFIRIIWERAQACRCRAWLLDGCQNTSLTGR
ncbi:hypothetical protein I7I53_10762 [Histoplasma capsulatum var. duboisii H88]|uniref:Uncharacterized protein n=1 Tax=Ajellomyces capsulatus (strain H88) TaxID=544711 RepID=A0A8A1LBG2_AJEC8|nr:hypothetical protein I7I53_10762 [Histoplasma capsulatum var. duboisii H88]